MSKNGSGPHALAQQERARDRRGHPRRAAGRRDAAGGALREPEVLRNALSECGHSVGPDLYV